MTDFETALRRLRDDVDGVIRPTPERLDRVLRRAGVRRAVTAVTALVGASVIVVAAVVGAGAIVSRTTDDSIRNLPASSDDIVGGREVGPGEKEVNFSFLLGGPCYGLILPEDFAEIPELSSPISERSFDFIRSENDDRPAETIDTLQGRDGREVDVAVMTEDPPQWSLRWPLANGALYTHVRGADGGPARAEVVASSITVRDSECGAGPEVEAHPPLEASVSEPPYQQSAAFSSPERPEWIVIIERPSHLPPGKTVVRAGDFGGYSAEKGTDMGLLVSVYVPTTEADARALLDLVADSLN